MVLMAAALLPAGASATTFTWNVTSGVWGTGSNWAGGTAPVSNTAGTVLNFTNGTSGTPAETSFTVDWQLATDNSVTVAANNTLTLTAAKTLQSLGAASVTNHGIIQSSSTSGKIRGAGGTRINDGTIQALSGGTLTLWDTGTITNTGGTIQAKSGGTVKFEGSDTISNGLLKSEAGGILLQDGTSNPGQSLTFTGVTVTNEGTFTNDQTTTSAASASTSLQTTLGTGTVFTNAVDATTQVRNTGSGTTSNASVRGSLFNVNAGSTFTNAGTLLIQNDATRTGTLTGQTVIFTVASGATGFSNTGTIKVIANTTATGATAAFTSAKSLTNDGVVFIKGNASSQWATFSVTGAGNDYTQSAGSGRRTVLEQGGALTIADQVLINGGTLGGTGTVNGATTIGSDATLVVAESLASAGIAGAGVLAFNNTLTLANDSEVKFGLGLNTAASGQIMLAGAANLSVGTNVMLTLSDLTAGNWVSGTTYRLFDLGSGSMDGANFVLNIVPAGWEGVMSSGAAGTDYLDLTLTAVANVPEPSSYAAVGGGLILLGAVCRRGRRVQADRLAPV